jgi:flagellar basal-body rod protein FlgB
MPFCVMIDMLFNNPALLALEKGLDATSLRARLIADNIANADTPNYKAQRLSFEDFLARELDADRPAGELPLLRTNPLHFPGGRRPDIQGIETTNGIIYTDRSLTFRLDGNNVDIDHEMAEQAKNAIQYSTLTELASRRLAILRTVISEGSR